MMITIDAIVNERDADGPYLAFDVALVAVAAAAAAVDDAYRLSLIWIKKES